MLQPDPARRPESMAALAAWLPELAPPRRSARAATRALSADIDIRHPKSLEAVPWRYAAIGVVLIALLAAVGAGVYFVAFRSPQLTAEGASDARGQGHQFDFGDRCGSRQKSGDAAAADRIKSYVQQYDGGNCFFLSPIAISNHAAALEGFGSSIRTVQSVRRSFQAAIRI